MMTIRSLVCLIGVTVVLGQEPAPVLRVLEPTTDTIMTGTTKFRISLTGGRLKQVQFQVDGVEVCRATAAPFECTWNAGGRIDSRVVRVVATLEDGRSVVAAVRTRGVTVSEITQVESVMVTALVTDSRGRFVSGLTANDFRVLDEGVAQDLTLVDAGQDGAELMVALDLSGSMFPLVDELKEVVRDFLGRLRPVDRVTLAGFNSGFFVLAPRDADAKARSLALANLDPYGGTAIYDAIIAGAKIVSDQPGRRAVVVFTDGDDVTSRSTLESAREELHADDAVLYLVATGKADSDPALRRGLTSLCIETGGAAYFAGKLSGTVEHFRQIMDDLARQYLLSFSPDPPGRDGKWRRLTVEPKDRSLRVRARTGYFASKRSGG